MAFGSSNIFSPVISLGNQPGAIALTRTPLRPHWHPSSRVRPDHAALDAT